MIKIRNTNNLVGLSILGLVKMKLMNALPGLIIAVVLVRLFVE